MNLPGPRDQIITKKLPEFVRLRTEVSRLVRGRPAPVKTDPASPEPAGGPAPASEPAAAHPGDSSARPESQWPHLSR